jgi:hypothetical protein
MSVAALSGIVFVPSLASPQQIKAGIILLLRQLPLVLDQRTLEELKTAFGAGLKLSECPTKQQQCVVANLVKNADEGRTLSSSRHTSDQTATGPESKTGSEETARWPVIWLMNEPPPQVPENSVAGLWISGINISDEPLRGVRAILKPDANQRALRLTVNIEGNHFADDAIVPPGSRFSLSLETSKTQTGGANLTFRYDYAGSQRVEIFYLTAAMIARLASAG